MYFVWFPNGKKGMELDVRPQVVEDYITWYRIDKQNQGDLWIKKGENNPQICWLENIDDKPQFYIQ